METAMLIQELSNRGADIKGAMERFLNDTELYATCLNMFVKDKAFMQLGEALDAGEAKQAFEAAHSLKGLAANLGLLPLYDTVSAMVEKLRAGQVEGHESAYADVLGYKAELEELIGRP